MATSKLYPTLSKFYEGQYIDIISEIDTACAEKVSEDKLYRKEPHQDRTNKVSTNKLNNLKSNNRKEDNMKSQIPSLYPRLSKNVTNHEKSEEHYSNIPQTLPTAPPVELLDEDFLRFIEDAIQDQNLNSSLDEIPTADYSSRTISDEIIFDNTWVDDMLPDYDITIENAEADFLNNLNKTDPKISQDKLLYDKAKTGHLVKLNIFPEGRTLEASNQRDMSRHRKGNEKTENNLGQAAHRPKHTHDKIDHLVERENRTAVTEDITNGRPTPGSPEYNAWMTWRKQVNRQLATVILLRRGGQVKLQKSDMSRKHLNQRSIEFVSKVVKSSNRTSLGEKPFVMYGIPRASLSGSQRELNQ